MGLAVCGGASCSCSFGTSPSSLMITPENKCMTSSPIATIADNIPMKNIMPFGMCSSMANPAVASATAAAMGVLTPQPCVPVVMSFWLPGSSKLFIGGKNALTSDSKVNCMYGGVISIINAGQTKIIA